MSRLGLGLGLGGGSGFISAAAVVIVTSLNYPVVDTGGATTVVITGSGFTAATAVKAGVTDMASYVVDSDTQITAVTPAKTAGTYTISVTASGVTGTSSAGFIEFWNPTVEAGLTLWLRGDRGVSGSPVDSWTDTQSGNGFSFTGVTTARPAFNATGMNGLPTLDSDGSTTFMSSTAGIANIISAAAETCAFAFVPVIYETNAATSYNNDTLLASHGYWGYHAKSGGPSLMHYQWSQNNTNTVIGPAATNKAILTNRHHGGNRDLAVNNGTPATAAASNVDTSGPALQMFSNAGAAVSKLRMAEVVTYNTDIGATALAKLTGYLNSRYQVY